MLCMIDKHVYRKELVQGHKGPLAESISSNADNCGSNVPALEDGQLLDRRQRTCLGGGRHQVDVGCCLQHSQSCRDHREDVGSAQPSKPVLISDLVCRAGL